MIIYNYFQKSHQKIKNNQIIITLIGLIFSLYLILILNSLQVPWAISILISNLVLLFFNRFKLVFFDFSKISISLNFSLWFLINFIIALSIFSISKQGLSTIWVNNYGDLPFHLGMSSSFSFSGNFYPEYHIFAGEKLSYPFLINLWSSLFLYIGNNIQLIKLVYILQWMFIWCGVYCLLNSNKNKILPWLVLFAGGSFALLGENSWEFISKGQPITVLLSSIWITQRSFMLGLLVLLSVLKLFDLKEYKLSFILLSTMPLVHGHSWLALEAYLFLYILFTNPKLIKDFVIYQLLAIPILLLVSSKTSILNFNPGWYAEDFMDQITFWVKNYGIGLLIILYFLIEKKKKLLILFILFVTFHFIHFSVWEWDQYKFFISLYLIFVYILSTLKLRKKEYILLIILIIPGMLESVKVLFKSSSDVIYPAHQLNEITNLRKQLPKNAVIATKPDHNSVVSLTGRSLYAGFAGWTSSHGLNPKKRNKINSDINLILNCKDKVCPNYIYHNGRNQFYKNLNKNKKLQRVDQTNLYKIKK